MKWIAAEELLAFRRCRRQPYLQQFGPQEQQIPPSDFLTQLRQGRQNHRDTIKLNAPGIDMGALNSKSWPELHARALRTLELMAAGEERIYRGVLMHPLNLPGNPILVCKPDILVRSPLPPPPDEPTPDRLESSNLELPNSAALLATIPSVGLSFLHPNDRQWRYIPADARASKRVKSDYAMVLALHSEVLRMVWGIDSDRAFAILADGKWRRVGLRTAKQNARQLLVDHASAMAQHEPPNVHMTRSRCSLCTWQDHCRSVARANHPLTLLPGVTATIYATLKEIGILSIEALAATTSDRIQHLPGIGQTTAHRLIHQAMAERDGTALSIKPFTLPRSPVELYFDIEAEPQRNVAYLLGVLAVNRQYNESTFHPFLAEHPDKERDCWNEFVQLTQRYPTAPIYHFHAFEIHTCRQLADRYSTSRTILQQILNRMVDLHEIASQCVVMPVESYSLKHMAKWQGFRWRQEDAGGAQAVYWYAQWLKTGDRSYLDASVTYNEDDCLATYHLKQWLERWEADHYPSPVTSLARCEIPAS
ncbi:MAG: TM0106 family RecB-like putative nuclease [Synechococcus sp.]